MSGFDFSSLGLGGVATAAVVAVGAYVKDHRKVKVEADRAEAILPMDLVHEATTIAKDQMTAMAGELARIQVRLANAEQENDQLRQTLADTRRALDLAHGHLREAWRKLNEVHPEAALPPWMTDPA